MLKCAKSITKEGLVWGACKFVFQPQYENHENSFGKYNALSKYLWLIIFYSILAKLVPVGYGINKLQLMCVVEDDKVSIDELSEQIAEFEDFVQSVDRAEYIILRIPID